MMKKSFNTDRVKLAVATAVVIGVFSLILYALSPLKFSSDHVTEIYYVDNISGAHQAVINAFNEEHEGSIRVTPVNLPFTKFSTNERKEILARTLRSKSDRVDVMAVDLIWVQRFAKWAHPLDAYFTPDDLKVINDFALQSCFSGNQLIAAPMYIDVGILYFRPDLIRKLDDGDRYIEQIKKGLTWEEFIALGLKLKALYPDVYLFAGDSFEGLLCSYYEAISVEDKDTIFLGDSVHLEHPASKQSMRLLHDLIYRHELAPEVVTGFDEVKCRQYVLDHDVPFIRYWPGLDLSSDLSDQERKYLESYDVAPLPRMQEQEKSAVFGGWNLIISSFSPHKEEAAVFVKFVQTEQAQKLLFERGGYIPVNRNVYSDSSFLRDNPDLTAMHTLLQMGKHRPYRNDYTRISDILSFYLNQYLEQKLTLQQAIAGAGDDISKKQLFLR